MNPKSSVALYIKNIDMSMKSLDVEAHIKQYCPVESVHVSNSKNARCSFQYAIVRVPNNRHALLLIEKLDKSPPYYWSVSFAETKESKEKKMASKFFRPDAHLNEEVRQCIEKDFINGSNIARNTNLKVIPTPFAKHNSELEQPIQNQLQKSKVETSTPSQLLNSKNGEQLLLFRRSCVRPNCGNASTKRCSICKATYCSKICQDDDWYEHSKGCRKPPPLEDIVSTDDEGPRDVVCHPCVYEATSSTSSSLSASNIFDQKEFICNTNSPRQPKLSTDYGVNHVGLRRPKLQINDHQITDQININSQKQFLVNNTKKIEAYKDGCITEYKRSNGFQSNILPFDDSESCFHITREMRLLDSYSGIITVHEPDFFIVRMVFPKYSEILTNALSKINGEPLLSSNVKNGDILLAESIDENWYRAIVIDDSKKTAGQVTVCYIDYGGRESVSRLMMLPEAIHLNLVPALALKAISFDERFKRDTQNYVDSQILFEIAEIRFDSVTGFSLEDDKPAYSFTLTPLLYDLKKNHGIFINICDNPSSNSDASLKKFKNVIAPEKYFSDRNKITKSPNEKSALPICSTPQMTTTNLSPSSDKTKYTRDNFTNREDLNIREKYDALVTCVSKGFICIQLQRDQHAIQSLNADIKKYYDKATTPLDVNEGEVLIGYQQEDFQWYRVEILRIIDKHKVLVLLMDFGQTSEIFIKDLRCFNPFLLVYPCFAIQLLPDSDKPTLGKNIVEEYASVQVVITYDKPMKGHLLVNGRQIWPEKVQVKPNSKCSEKEKIIKQQVETETALSDPTKVTNSFINVPNGNQELNIEDRNLLKSGNLHPEVKGYEDYKTTGLPANTNGVNCLILHTSGPLSVFVLAEEKKDLLIKFEEYSDEMNAYCNSIPKPFYRPNEGEVCLAKYSLDNNWYRCACIVRNAADATVFFVDYGNTETVPYTRMCQMVDKFADIDLLAVHCRLKGFEEKHVKDDEIKGIISELLPSFSTFSLNVFSCEDDVYEVEIPFVQEKLMSFM